MKAALIRVKNYCRNNQAQQKGPDQCRQGSRGPAAQPGDVDSGDAVTNAVAQRANEQDLLGGKNGQGGPGITREGKVADEKGNSPINANAENASSRPRNGTRA